MKTEANEPINADKNYGNIGSMGLTKREHFAAMAMQGMLASEYYKSASLEKVATDAVLQADKLITALNK